MAVNYNDSRFTAVKNEEQVELDKIEAQYDSMIKDNEDSVQNLIDQSKEAAEKLKEEQNALTEHQINTIEQQKEQSQKDYIKEQSGSYVDWQKESNKYGAKEEQLASAGLTGSGYHESTQVSIYNSYQNRVAIARDSFERSKLNFENSIKEAQLQNSSILAEIALNAQKEQLQLALDGLQYKNKLLQEKTDKALNIKSLYYSKWQDVLNQINAEIEQAEKVRQFNLSLEEEQRQFNIQHGIDNAYADVEKEKTSETKTSNNDARNFKTDYFQGSIPGMTLLASQRFGTFDNGYQPRGIISYGKLTNTGKTIDVKVKKISGEETFVERRVWQTPDGTLWYWSDNQMTYKQLSASSATKVAAGSLVNSTVKSTPSYVPSQLGGNASVAPSYVPSQLK